MTTTGGGGGGGAPYIHNLDDDLLGVD